MQRRMAMFVFAAFCALGVSAAQAKGPGKEAAKEVTLQGEMVCGHCTLKETKGCQNVLKVADGDKETKYFLKENEVSKANHGPVCGAGAQATVTGTVQVQGKKHLLTPTEISFAK